MNHTSLIHPTYRHLDRRVRIAGLPLAHWVQLVFAGVVAYALAHVLPFGPTYDLSVAVTVAGVPVAATLAAGTGQHPLSFAAALIRWRLRARAYAPSRPGSAASGYALCADDRRRP